MRVLSREAQVISAASSCPIYRRLVMTFASSLGFRGTIRASSGFEGAFQEGSISPRPWPT